MMDAALHSSRVLDVLLSELRCVQGDARTRILLFAFGAADDKLKLKIDEEDEDAKVLTKLVTRRTIRNGPQSSCLSHRLLAASLL